jgi:hypothetical protein
MKEVRLLYASTVADNFDPAELDNILEVARTQNAEHRITGVLFFNTTHFIQCIEGARKAVNALYSDMQKDPRHNELILLSYKDIDERMFADWEMAYIEPDDIDEEILEKHSAGPGFDPASIDEDMAEAMLLLLVQHLEK